MVEQSQNTYIRTIKDKDTEVVYTLFFQNALYSMECYKENEEKSKVYCYIENLTEDEGEAEYFLKRMVKGKVSPIHMKDLAQDYFFK